MEIKVRYIKVSSWYMVVKHWQDLNLGLPYSKILATLCPSREHCVLRIIPDQQGPLVLPQDRGHRPNHPKEVSLGHCKGKGQGTEWGLRPPPQWLQQEAAKHSPLPATTPPLLQSPSPQPLCRADHLEGPGRGGISGSPKPPIMWYPLKLSSWNFFCSKCFPGSGRVFQLKQMAYMEVGFSAWILFCINFDLEKCSANVLLILITEVFCGTFWSFAHEVYDCSRFSIPQLFLLLSHALPDLRGGILDLCWRAWALELVWIQILVLYLAGFVVLGKLLNFTGLRSVFLSISLQ